MAPPTTRIILAQAPWAWNSWLLRYIWSWFRGMAYDKEKSELYDHMLDLIEEERLRFPDQDSKRVFIGGNSQGTIVTLAAYLRYKGPTRLGGYCGILAVNLLPPEEAQRSPAAIKMQSETPMLLYNGEDDPIL